MTTDEPRRFIYRLPSSKTAIILTTARYAITGWNVLPSHITAEPDLNEASRSNSLTINHLILLSLFLIRCSVSPSTSYVVLLLWTYVYPQYFVLLFLQFKLRFTHHVQRSWSYEISLFSNMYNSALLVHGRLSWLQILPLAEHEHAREASRLAGKWNTRNRYAKWCGTSYWQPYNGVDLFLGGKTGPFLGAAIIPSEL